MILLNNTDLLDHNWRFIEPLCTNLDVRWKFFHGIPNKKIEHIIRRPNLARYRAALSTVLCARNEKDSALIISHLPSMAAPTNIFRRKICPEVPQIAFSFNFTTLPTGARRRLMNRALKDINEFVVFSKHEIDVYSDHFDLDRKKFHFLHWAMNAPHFDPIPPFLTGTEYVCAIGGEGRDYELFSRAMTKLPHLRGVVIARPYSIEGVSFPSNVEVYVNLPLGQTWSIAKHSLGLVIPLKSSETACGHVTIVGAQHLGVPLIVTRSLAVTDYVSPETARLISAGSEEELTAALIELTEEKHVVAQRRDQARRQATYQNCPSIWVEYLTEACKRLTI